MAEEQPRQFRHTDEIATVEFRAETRGALASLHDAIEHVKNSFSEFKLGLGKRMDEANESIQDHDTRLTRIETSLNAMVKVTWVIVACSIGTIAAAIYKVILK